MIIDEQPLMRQGMIHFFKEYYPKTQIQESSNISDSLKKLRLEDFDIVILDIQLDGANNLDHIKDIKQVRPGTPVLVFSNIDEHMALRAIRNGASGFLRKNESLDELQRAVTKLLEGGVYINPDMAEKLATRLQDDYSGPIHEKLTDREFQIFLKIGSGKTVSIIAKELTLSVKTVSTYRSRILKKMHLSTNMEIMRYVITNRLLP